MLNKIPNNVQNIINLINNNGGHCYIVGGFVRDTILKRVTKDIDIEVHQLSVDNLITILEKEYTVKIQGNFGVLVLKEVADLEISLPRYENQIGQHHCDFEINIDPFMGNYEASMRRDFTINALMYDTINDDIIDYHGGLDDLKNRKLRHVSDKFSEDALRVFRAVRFSSTLGFEIDEETIELCKKIDLSELSQYRVNDEMKKILLGNYINIGYKYFDLLLSEFFFGEKKIKCDDISCNLKRIVDTNINENSKILATNFLICKDMDYSYYIEEVIANKKLKKYLSNMLKSEKKITLEEIYDKVEFYGQMFPIHITLLKYSNERIIPSNYIEDLENSINLMREIKELKSEFNGEYIMKLGFEGKEISQKQKELIINELNSFSKNIAFLKNML